MALWRNITRLAGIGARQGVQDPGPTDVLTPVQTVQIVDDVSHGVRPLSVPYTTCFVDVPSVANERGSFVFLSGPRGSILRWHLGTNGASAGIIQDTILAPVARGTIPVAATPGGAFQTQLWDQEQVPLFTIVNLGTNPNPSGFVQFGFAYIDYGNTDFNIYVAPGTEVYYESPTLTSAARWVFMVQDIPE